MSSISHTPARGPISSSDFTVPAARFRGDVRMHARPCICRCEQSAPAGHFFDTSRSGSPTVASPEASVNDTLEAGPAPQTLCSVRNKGRSTSGGGPGQRRSLLPGPSGHVLRKRRVSIIGDRTRVCQTHLRGMHSCRYASRQQRAGGRPAQFRQWLLQSRWVRDELFAWTTNAQTRPGTSHCETLRDSRPGRALGGDQDLLIG